MSGVIQRCTFCNSVLTVARDDYSAERETVTYQCARCKAVFVREIVFDVHTADVVSDKMRYTKAPDAPIGAAVVKPLEQPTSSLAGLKTEKPEKPTTEAPIGAVPVVVDNENITLEPVKKKKKQAPKAGERIVTVWLSPEEAKLAEEMLGKKDFRPSEFKKWTLDAMAGLKRVKENTAAKLQALKNKQGGEAHG